MQTGGGGVYILDFLLTEQKALPVYSFHITVKRYGHNRAQGRTHILIKQASAQLMVKSASCSNELTQITRELASDHILLAPPHGKEKHIKHHRQGTTAAN